MLTSYYPATTSEKPEMGIPVSAQLFSSLSLCYALCRIPKMHSLCRSLLAKLAFRSKVRPEAGIITFGKKVKNK